MTPLAYQITKQLTLPIKKRWFNDAGDLLRRMDDIHCFETTEVLALTDTVFGGEQLPASDSADGRRVLEVCDTVNFLPAPKTWVEWQFEGTRSGLLFQQDRRGVLSVRFASSAAKLGLNSLPFTLVMPGERQPWKYQGAQPTPVMIPEITAITVRGMIMLALINTPRHIGRRQHMPSRLLEQRLLAKKAIIGKWPLHAWNEIKLEVTIPEDLSGEMAVEAHLTGRRALHFCRAHLRIKNHQIEFVRSHWRGDAALGIKQTRYKLTDGPRSQEVVRRLTDGDAHG